MQIKAVNFLSCGILKILMNTQLFPAVFSQQSREAMRHLAARRIPLQMCRSQIKDRIVSHPYALEYGRMTDYQVLSSNKSLQHPGSSVLVI